MGENDVTLHVLNQANSCKNAWDNVPYLALNEVLKIFRFSLPLPTLSELLSMQDHDQSLGKQPGMGKREGVCFVT